MVGFTELWSFQHRLSNPSAFMCSKEANLTSFSKCKSWQMYWNHYCPWFVATALWQVTPGFLLGGGCGEKVRGWTKNIMMIKSHRWFLRCCFELGIGRLNKPVKHTENSMSWEFVVCFASHLACETKHMWHPTMAMVHGILLSCLVSEALVYLLGGWFDGFDTFCIWWYWCCVSNVGIIPEMRCILQKKKQTS